MLTKGEKEVGRKCVLSHFSRVLLFVTPWTVARRLLCPWNSSGKNTGVGCHILLQRIFLTQGSNPRFLHILHWQVGSLPLVPPSTVNKESLACYWLTPLPRKRWSRSSSCWALLSLGVRALPSGLSILFN